MAVFVSCDLAELVPDLFVFLSSGAAGALAMFLCLRRRLGSSEGE